MSWCDFCGKKANVLYYAESKNPKGYEPRLAGYAICLKCDCKALKTLKISKNKGDV